MLEVEIVTGNVTVICRTKGSLNATTVTTFRGAVTLCLGEPGLIIDLSGLDFLDGAGLNALVGAIRRAREQRTQVALVVSPGSVRNVLDEAGLDLIVSVSDTVDSAMDEIHNDARTPEHVDCRP